MTHSCLRPTCSNTYEDDDIERYYCPSCKEENKRIAQEIDRKLANRSTERVVSGLQAFEAGAKTFTTPNGRSITFGKA